MRKNEKEAYAVRLVVNLMCHRQRPVKLKDEEGNEIPQPSQPDAVDLALMIVDKIADHSDENWGPEAMDIPSLSDAISSDIKKRYDYEDILQREYESGIMPFTKEEAATG